MVEAFGYQRVGHRGFAQGDLPAVTQREVGEVAIVAVGALAAKESL